MSADREHNPDLVVPLLQAKDQKETRMTTPQYPSAIDTPGPARPPGRPTTEDLRMIERTRGARDLLSSKWKVDLLYLLARGVRRYSRLYDNLRGASKKMLTDSLRSLERDGLVERHVYAEVPVRVEYSLTTLGWSATELLIALADWADEHMPDVEEARKRYDEVGRRTPVGSTRPSSLPAVA
jgi:DNA-binding HxlR family transcriptional regulator